MSKKPESILKEKILRELRLLPFSFWEKIQQTSKRGTPDIVGCFQGLFYGIEIKEEICNHLKPHEKLQMHKLGKIMEAGGAGIIMTNDNYKMIIQKMRDNVARQAK